MIIESVLFLLGFIVIIIITPIIVQRDLLGVNTFLENNYWLGPISLFIILFVVPLGMVYWEHRRSGVPFDLVLQSFLEYVFGDKLTRRLSTLKLVITEKELEENK